MLQTFIFLSKESEIIQSVFKEVRSLELTIDHLLEISSQTQKVSKRDYFEEII